MFCIQPASGDLTRIGRLPEAAFGWNAPQPRHRRQPSSVASVLDADALVLGDSFSMDGLWQEAAFGPNMQYGTLHWTGDLCSDFSQTLSATGAAPRILVLETVERHLKDHLPPGCKKSNVIRWRALEPLGGPLSTATREQYWVFGGSFGYRYMFGSLAFMVSPKEQHRDGDYDGVEVIRVRGGCQVFSNSACDLGLFLGWDFTKRAVDDGLYAAISEGIAAAMRSATVVVLVVVPNKSSIYLGSLDEAKQKDLILRRLASRTGLIVVPLFERFHGAAREVRDFYLPNDTHLSTVGYQYLGREVRSAVNGVLPIAPDSRKP
jgi:hypothetical protein